MRACARACARARTRACVCVRVWPNKWHSIKCKLRAEQEAGRRQMRPLRNVSAELLLALAVSLFCLNKSNCARTLFVDNQLGCQLNRAPSTIQENPHSYATTTKNSIAIHLAHSRAHKVAGSAMRTAAQGKPSENIRARKRGGSQLFIIISISQPIKRADAC